MKSTFVFLFALLANLAFSQTNVGGVYNSDQHWTMSGSPYRVTADVTLPLNVTLTIDPGVEVFVDSGQSILITDGALIAVGLPGNEIWFHGDFPAVLIHFSSADMTISQMSYCKFQGGSAAIYAANYSWVPSLNTDATFDHLSFYLTRVYAKNIQFRHSSFNMTGLNWNLNIDSSWIDNCEISLYTEIGEPFQSTITNSYIGHSHVDALGKYLFVGDTIMDCVLDGYERPDNWGELDHCWIADSEFRASGGSTYPLHRFKIRNSILLRNEMYTSLQQWPQPNNANDPSTELDHCIVQMDGSETWWVSMSLFNHVAFIGVPNGQELETSISSVSNCLFWGSDLKPIVYTSSYFPTAMFTDCNFMQLGTKIACKGAPNLDAYNCWWGSTDPQMIDNGIWDGHDHLSYGYVNYSPMLSTPNIAAPISPPTGLNVTAGTGYHVLTWNANPEADLDGYKLHYGSFNGWSYRDQLLLGNVTTFQIPDSIFNQGFAITAYDPDVDGINDQVEGHESWYATYLGLPTSTVSVQNTLDLKLTVYPNPVEDWLHVTVAGTKGPLELTLYDMQGRVLRTESGKGDRHSLDVSNLPGGAYLLRCDAGKVNATARVIVR